MAVKIKNIWIFAIKTFIKIVVVKKGYWEDYEIQVLSLSHQNVRR